MFSAYYLFPFKRTHRLIIYKEIVVGYYEMYVYETHECTGHKMQRYYIEVVGTTVLEKLFQTPI
jgi:hypothetical protein